MRQDPATRATDPESVFDVVLVGIDDTPESLVAAAQAGVLRTERSTLGLVAVAERYLAAHAGLAAGHASTKVTETVSADLAHARLLLDADETVLAEGRLVSVLHAEASRRRATLVVVGGRPHGRLRARTLGGHDEEALSASQCSLMIARPGWGPRRPDDVVLSLGASSAGGRADEAAAHLATRLGCELVVAVGLEDDPELDAVARGRPDAVLDPGSQSEAAAHATTPRSLLVVDGDLGDERVRRIVYAVPCSVLVVRAIARAEAEAS